MSTVSWAEYKLAAERCRLRVNRGKCPRCGYVVRLRANGYPQRHSVFAGYERFTCPGGEPCRTDEPPYPLATWLAEQSCV